MTTDTKLAEVMALAKQYADEDAYGELLSIKAEREERSYRRKRLESAVAGILTALEEAQADARKWRELMPLLLDELEAHPDGDGNAPGHAHQRPGVWDDDNGELAGKPCAWCATWNAAAPQPSDAKASA